MSLERKTELQGVQPSQNKFGIQLYQVCEASSGYCLGLDVYAGNTLENTNYKFVNL
ncbi:hypothetical protein DPMN_131087 [Dreissena polymorpha]|uniref:Uncharacterized protein n=1 Tax=Dreissena polymorpha TaxID=45954 RepID=A0A9D4JZR0_DREPO|nr:hypothetical protein DPMN_131086 [Dreissena polymorpha]KAH3829099.1 hypothetical protein DPMN_131087 [Dreissena polymorpha]